MAYLEYLRVKNGHLVPELHWGGKESIAVLLLGSNLMATTRLFFRKYWPARTNPISRRPVWLIMRWFLRASSEACSARLRLILTRFEGEVEVGCGDILWNMSCRGYIKAGTWILEVIRGHQGCLRPSEASSSLGGQWMIIGFRKICPIQPFRGQRSNFLLVSISKTGKY